MPRPFASSSTPGGELANLARSESVDDLYNQSVQVMSSVISYTEARANLASLWDRVLADREAVVIHRRGKEDVAVLPAAELEAILETAHLLRSPRNAERLLRALTRAREQAGEPSTVEDLRAEAGLG